jgi:hypothetical protein
MHTTLYVLSVGGQSVGVGFDSGGVTASPSSQFRRLYLSGTDRVDFSGKLNLKMFYRILSTFIHLRKKR